MAELPRARRTRRLDEDERCIFEAYTELRLADTVQLARVESEGVRHSLETLFAHLSASLWKFSDVITRSYFSHAQPVSQLAPQFQNEEL